MVPHVTSDLDPSLPTAQPPAPHSRPDPSAKHPAHWRNKTAAHARVGGLRRDQHRSPLFRVRDTRLRRAWGPSIVCQRLSSRRREPAEFRLHLPDLHGRHPRPAPHTQGHVCPQRSRSQQTGAQRFTFPSARVRDGDDPIGAKTPSTQTWKLCDLVAPGPSGPLSKGRFHGIPTAGNGPQTQRTEQTDPI